MEFLHMSKKLKWPGIATLVPNEEEFPCKCGQEGRTVNEAGVARSGFLQSGFEGGKNLV